MKCESSRPKLETRIERLVRILGIENQEANYESMRQDPRGGVGQWQE